MGDKTTPKFPKELARYDKNAPRCKWKDWYNEVVVLRLKGYSFNEIAKKLGKHPNTVIKVRNRPDFDAKMDEFQLKQLDSGADALSVLDSKKSELIKNQIQLALHGEKEATRASATQWLLERFPEFAPKNVPNIVTQTNVYQHDKEDTKRLDTTADKLTRMHQFIVEGDIPIIDVSEGEFDDRPIEDTDK